MKKIVIVGATSSIAEHCARLWAKAPVTLELVGRDAEKLERVAADLRVRSPHSAINTRIADFLDPHKIEAMAAEIVAAGAVDIVLIAHGSLPEQEQCQSDLAACREALDINGVSPALYAEAFARYMAAAGRGTLAVIGSVAGDRGRKSNYAYGAAKGMLARYVEGMQHRFAGSGVKIVLVKPGPTDTPMTAHMKAKGAGLAPVADVAQCIVSAVEQGRPVVYAPGKWALIMLIIRHLPRFAFNRMNI